MTETPLTRLADEVAKLDEATQKRFKPIVDALNHADAEVVRMSGEMMEGLQFFKTTLAERTKQRDEAIGKLAAARASLRYNSPN